MRTSYLFIALSLCATLMVIGCSDADFDSVTEVYSPRIVDVIEDPVRVAPGESTSIRPVVVAPSTHSGAIHLSYQICLFSAGANHYYRCAEELPIPGFSNILAEDSGDTFSFTQSVLSNDQLHAVCDIFAGRNEDVDIPPGALAGLPQCVVGLPVSLRVKMCLESSECEDEDALVARKTMQLLFEESAGRADRNLNPQIDGLHFDDVELNEGQPHTVSLDCDPCEFELEISADPSVSAQVFSPLEEGEDAEAQREELETRWFATTPGIESSRRYYREGITTDEEFRQNSIKLDPEKLNDGETVDLWVVLRDSRLGSDVIHRQIVIQKQ